MTDRDTGYCHVAGTATYVRLDHCFARSRPLAASVGLDYSATGPDGEPAVVYVDEDRLPRRIAASFEEFMNGLASCEAYFEEDEDQ